MTNFLRLFLLISSFHTYANWEVISPDGKLKGEIGFSASGQLSYTVKYQNNGLWETVILNSGLGIQRSDEDFSQGLTFQSFTRDTINETYEMKSGKRLIERHFSHGLQLNFTKNSKTMILETRTFNDGFAFRYIFPEAPGYTVYVIEDKSKFGIPTGGKKWSQEYSLVKPVYEKRFKERNVGDYTNDGWCFPALMQSGSYFVLLGETNIKDDNVGSHLTNYNYANNTYGVGHPPSYDGSGYSEAYPVIHSAIELPWKFITIGIELKTIIESNHTNHLAEPSVLTNTDWIKPGISSFSWWSDFNSAEDLSKLKKFARLADTLNLPYTLADAGWSKMPSGSLEELISYSDSLNVGVWVWYNSGGSHSSYDYEPRDRMVDPIIRRNEMQWLKSIGAKAIKVDFFESEKVFANKLFIDILKDAADFELMVSFHGCNPPRGWQRTYPHLLTVEAVKGAEGLLFDTPFRNDSPLHNVNLVFTRNVVGSMDYTPGVIGYERVGHNSTKAHEIAIINIFESGNVNLADSYENYMALSANERNLLSMPTAWESTKFIAGHPNEYVVVARKSGNSWYLSGINGVSTSSNLQIDLEGFLPQGLYSVKGIKDHSSNPQEIVFENIDNHRSENSLNFSMLPYGGFLYRFDLICQDDLSLTNTVSNELAVEYHGKRILSNQYIDNSNYAASYFAEQYIQLNPGFQSKYGNSIKVEIKNCLAD